MAEYEEGQVVESRAEVVAYLQWIAQNHPALISSLEAETQRQLARCVGLEHFKKVVDEYVEADENTRKELLQILRKREASIREARDNDRTRGLTEEEKALSPGELYRKWKCEDQQRRGETVELSKADRDPNWSLIEDFTPEQKALPKTEVRKILRAKRDLLWRMRMADRNIETHQCDVCQRFVTDRHRCFSTGMRVPGKSDTAYQKSTLVVQQTGKGPVHIKTVPVVSPEAMEKEYQKLVQMKAEAEEAMRTLQSNLACLDDDDAEDDFLSPRPCATGATAHPVRPPDDPTQSCL